MIFPIHNFYILEEIKFSMKNLTGKSCRLNTSIFIIMEKWNTSLRYGANFAEEMYSELKVRMNHVVTRRVLLIFYNTSNRFPTDEYYSRVDSARCLEVFLNFLRGRVVLPSNGSFEKISST